MSLSVTDVLSRIVHLPEQGMHHLAELFHPRSHHSSPEKTVASHPADLGAHLMKGTDLEVRGATSHRISGGHQLDVAVRDRGDNNSHCRLQTNDHDRIIFCEQLPSLEVDPQLRNNQLRALSQNFSEMGRELEMQTVVMESVEPMDALTLLQDGWRPTGSVRQQTEFFASLEKNWSQFASASHASLALKASVTTALGTQQISQESVDQRLSVICRLPASEVAQLFVGVDWDAYLQLKNSEDIGDIVC